MRLCKPYTLTFCSYVIFIIDTQNNIVPVSSSSDPLDQSSPPSPTSVDGWGELENGLHEDHDSDKEGWDDIDPLEEQKPPPSLASIQAAQKRPVLQPKRCKFI